MTTKRASERESGRKSFLSKVDFKFKLYPLSISHYSTMCNLYSFICTLKLCRMQISYDRNALKTDGDKVSQK